jgi:PPOX class probable F420-dependent enzyme
MFTDADRELLDLSGFARMATLMPDGAPQLTVLWYRRVDDTLRIICPASAQKRRNLERDPRVAVIVEDPQSAFRFLEIRGQAEVVHDDTGARAELVQIARRYIGAQAEAYAAGLSADPRVILVVRPERIIRHF